MGKCLFMRKGETHTAPVNYKANFADNTWEQIIDACQKNAVPETWLVGDQKAMTINGTDYLIDIIGKNHDDYADGSGKAPLTFQMHDCYETAYAMNSSDTNSGGWASCAMRNTHLPVVMALMPLEVQTGIKEVNKLTSEGGGSNVISTTADKLFLLSEIEIFGVVTNSVNGEGTQYAYYSAGNSRIKNKTSGATIWRERSPLNNNYASFCCVMNDGTQSVGGASTALYLAFAFCF